MTRLNMGTAILPYGSIVPTLVTTPLQPSRLCLGLIVPIESGSLAGASDLMLASSDDSGATWRYTPMSNVNFDGRSGDPEPIMDAYGSCYVTLQASDAVGTEQIFPSHDSMIVRLAPGARAQTEVVATFTSQSASVGAIFITSLATQRRLLIVSVPIPTYYDPYFHATLTTNQRPDYNTPNLLVDTVPV